MTGLYDAIFAINYQMNPTSDAKKNEYLDGAE